MPFTDFCIDYIPMYSKFRAVSSALVVAEFTIPLLALLGLKELCSEDGFQKYGKQLFISFGIVGAITLVFAVAPGLFFDRFLSLSEMEAIKNGVDSSMQSSLINNITEMRQAVFTADAWRSLFVIVLGFVALVLYGMNKIKQPVLAGALIAICLVDMWTVDKRYLNDEMFVPKSNQTETFAQTLIDECDLDAYAPYSGTKFDLISNTFDYEADGIRIEAKKIKKISGVFNRLMEAGQRLIGIIKKSEGMANKDLAKFADQINSLCDKWDR